MRLASFVLLAVIAPVTALDPPTISATGPTSSSTQKTTFTLKGTSANAPAGISVTVGQVVNGVEAPVKGGTYTATVNAKTGDWSVDITLPVGTGYTVYAILDGTSNPIQFDEIYDITVAAPVCAAVADDIGLAITAPLANSRVGRAGCAPTISTWADLYVGTSANVYIEVVDIATNGVNYYYGDTYAAGSGVNTHDTVPNPLPAGTYRVTIWSDATCTPQSLTFTVAP